jgi:hypothetical protein
VWSFHPLHLAGVTGAQEKQMKDVFAIYETKTEGKERSRWVRVGVAFPHRDGSLNVLFDAIPLSGRLQIRDREERQNGKEQPR